MNRGIFSHYEIKDADYIDLDGVLSLVITNTGEAKAIYDRIGIIPPGAEVEIIKPGDLILINKEPLKITFEEVGKKNLHIRLIKIR